MDAKSAFINDHGRVRSGWRVAIFLALFIFVELLAGSAIAGIFFLTGFDADQHKLLFPTLSGLIGLIPAIGIGWVCGKFLESLPFRALGCWFTEGWLKHLLLGLLIGALTISIAIIIASVFGGLSFTFDLINSREAIAESLILSFGVFTIAAAFEEALFRGYMLQTLNRAGFAWLAISLTAIFFGLVHLGNQSANAVSTANTMLAGIWFGVAYLKTRDLWFPFGIHLMWNWLQGSVFGIEVSGLREISSAPLFNEIDRGPEWLTGADYGIEASIACTFTIIISTLVIYFIPIKKSELPA